MKRLSPKDKKVVDAFTDKRSMDSKKLTSDGKTLDGNWMGGRGIAIWQGNMIVLQDLGSRSSQMVQRYLKKVTPKNRILEGADSSLESLIESISDRVILEYVMPEPEREQQAMLKRSLKLNKDHLDVLKFLVMSDAINSPNRAIDASDLKAFPQKALDDLMKLEMIKGVANPRNPRGLPAKYYTSMKGFLMGHAYQRRYVKA